MTDTHDHHFVLVREITRIFRDETYQLFGRCKRCEMTLFWTKFTRDWLGVDDLNTLMSVAVHVFTAADDLTVEEILELVVFDDTYDPPPDLEEEIDLLLGQYRENEEAKGEKVTSLFEGAQTTGGWQLFDPDTLREPSYQDLRIEETLREMHKPIGEYIVAVAPLRQIS